MSFLTCAAAVSACSLFSLHALVPRFHAFLFPQQHATIRRNNMSKSDDGKLSKGDNGMLPDIGEVAPLSLSYADFGDLFILTQVSKNWREYLAIAEKEIFLHLLRKYRPILVLFSHRLENIPANALPSTRWKMIFRFSYELLKSSYIHSNEPFRLAGIHLGDVLPPMQADQFVIAQGRNKLCTSSVLVSNDGALEFTATYPPGVNWNASSLETVTFALYKGTTHFSKLLPLGIAPDHSTFLLTAANPRTKRFSTAGFLYEWTIEPHYWHPFAHSPEVTIVTHGMAFEYRDAMRGVKFLLRFDFKIGEDSYDNLSKLEVLRLFEGIVGRSPVQYRRFEIDGLDGDRVKALFENGTLNHRAPLQLMYLYSLIPSLMECKPEVLRAAYRRIARVVRHLESNAA